MEQEVNPNQYNQIIGDVNGRIRNLEEKQRILKDRLILIGENLIETRERTNEKVLEIKKDIEILKQNMERMLSFLESASTEFSKFAKKDDLEILTKQAKMFQPIDFITKKDLDDHKHD
jgi:predicted  nucleic acid-binding Zn-ribbon protein